MSLVVTTVAVNTLRASAHVPAPFLPQEKHDLKHDFKHIFHEFRHIPWCQIELQRALEEVEAVVAAP